MRRALVMAVVAFWFAPTGLQVAEATLQTSGFPGSGFPDMNVGAMHDASLRQDTLSAADTLQPTAADTITAVASPSGIDSVVIYSASDSIIYSISTKTMHLHGKGDIKYKQLGLKSENIDINWNTATLTATGVPDTADTTGKRYRGLPDLIDGGETYKGHKVTYNFRTKKGKIDVGETEMQEGYYYGEAIKKVGDDVLFVGHGRYTTCDLDHPHYYFGSPTMKVIPQDKVVARPVYLYISDVPVFALPFGVFPNQRGRRSGVIAPAYGESSRGRYLTHLGYYWAINDYMDWSITGDGYTKGSWNLTSNFRYALRYEFTGSISGSYAETVDRERGDPDFSKQNLFNLQLRHNQTINPTTRLDVDFTFTSGSYYQQTSNNLNDLLRQNVISNATLSKSWEGTPHSMSVNIKRDHNLQTGARSEILPSISFSRAQTFPFRSARNTDPSEMGLHELIGFTYNSQFVNRMNKSVLLEGGFQRDERRGVTHRLATNLSPKVGYITLTPFFNYTENWYDKSIRREFVLEDSSVATHDVHALKAVRFFDTGISASTKLYGIFRPNILGITGVRHQVLPSITYTYQPDFSRPSYGYYGRYTDEFGREVKYSFYEREVYGGAPGEERQAIGFSLGNIFEMKTLPTDTSTEENKFQLLNLNIATGYNFARDSLKLDEISMSYRTSIGTLLDIGGSSRFNVYKFEPDPLRPQVGRRVNKFLVNETGQLWQMTSFSVSISTRLSGERKTTTAGSAHAGEDTLAEATPRSGYVGMFDTDEPDFSIPWHLDLSWNFSQNQADPRVKTRGSSIAASLGFNLTEYWKFTASTSYDLVNKEFGAPSITIYRDLHCWEMNFRWVPTGAYRHFQLEIRVKAPQLQDVKVTKQASARGIF